LRNRRWSASRRAKTNSAKKEFLVRFGLECGGSTPLCDSSRLDGCAVPAKPRADTSTLPVMNAFSAYWSHHPSLLKFSLRGWKNELQILDLSEASLCIRKTDTMAMPSFGGIAAVWQF
jgi:hypothetical protein